MANTNPDRWLSRWRAFTESHDSSMLWAMLHPDAVFESPVVHTPQRGRSMVFAYLTSAGTILGGQNFRYTGEWHSNDGAILEFETEIEGIRINGVDMIRWDSEGQITHFKVMVRPLKAINLVHRLMGEALESFRNQTSG